MRQFANENAFVRDELRMHAASVWLADVPDLRLTTSPHGEEALIEAFTPLCQLFGILVVPQSRHFVVLACTHELWLAIACAQSSGSRPKADLLHHSDAFASLLLLSPRLIDDLAERSQRREGDKSKSHACCIGRVGHFGETQ